LRAARDAREGEREREREGVRVCWANKSSSLFVKNAAVKIENREKLKK